MDLCRSSLTARRSRSTSTMSYISYQAASSSVGPASSGADQWALPPIASANVSNSRNRSSPQRSPRPRSVALPNAVVLTGHALPPGWSHDRTDVLFLFPDNYPAGCPDNICARPDLRLANGELPGNNQGIQRHAGADWLQLSWHIEGADWRSTADPRNGSNLATYLLGALARFEEPT
jgi:hypothetical protein